MLKVFWFRQSAHLARWQEEEALLKEEMQRTVRYFKYKKEIWDNGAQAEEGRQNWGSVGYSRMQVHMWEHLLEQVI